MLNENHILVGKGENEVFILPEMANRHGLICGATGTGKTITMKVMAESFSSMGVPVFMADIKGDVSGTARMGTRSEAITKRLEGMGIDPGDFHCRSFPCRFWDVFGEGGHPVRTTISELGSELLSRILSLTDAQRGVLAIVFRVADDKGWLLDDLKDLRAMVSWVCDHSSELLNDYGNVSKTSAGAVQRALLQLEDAGGNIFFGTPSISISDWMQTDENGMGYINIFHCAKLYRSPLLYSTFMLWLLSELFEELPEVGDPEKPKLVFFFDEAHLLFRDAPKTLVSSVEQVVKLIRSKGVGVYFVSQQPSDIPNAVLSQLGNKVQHALRAYTPAELKSVKAAAQSFRANPAFDTEDAILDLGTGEAIVSFLDAKGRPNIAERATILPPQSDMGAIDDNYRQRYILTDTMYGKYEDVIDGESAYEKINAIKAAEEEKAKKEEEKKAAAEKKAAKSTGTTSRKTSTASKKKSTASTLLSKTGTSLANTVGRELGKSIARGILGSIKR